MNSLYSSLISYWNLHEPSGSRYDSTGQGNALTDNNTVVQAAGRVIYAGDFTAANSESLSVTDNASLSMGDIDFTLSAWVNAKTLSTQIFIGKLGAAGSREYDLYITDATGTITFRVSSDGTALSTLASSNAIAAGTWNLVFAWHDAVNNTMNIWLNGTITSTAYATGVTDKTAAFRLGANDTGGYYNGYLCEAAVWKRVLVEQERRWLYNNGMGRTYPFDGRVSPAMLGRQKMKHRNRLTGMAV